MEIKQKREEMIDQKGLLIFFEGFLIIKSDRLIKNIPITIHSIICKLISNEVITVRLNVI